MKISRYKVISFLSVFILLIIWFLLTLNQSKNQELLFPSLSKMFIAFGDNFQNTINYSLITWYRVLVGMLIGMFFGLFIGIFITWNKYIEAVVDPIIEIIRPIPPIALTPFFILWFGLGDIGQLLLVALGCFMVIVISTVNAIRNVKIIYIRAARSLGASDIDIYRTVFLPAILPSLSSAVRVSAATGFGLTVAAEYLGAQGGLGFLIRNARVTLNTEVIMLAAILLGILSLVTDQLIRLIFGLLTKWNNN